MNKEKNIRIQEKKYKLIYFKESTGKNEEYTVSDIVEQNGTHLKAVVEKFRQFKVENIRSLKPI